LFHFLEKNDVIIFKNEEVKEKTFKRIDYASIEKLKTEIYKFLNVVQKIKSTCDKTGLVINLFGNLIPH
jgi:hypothetical protein